MYDGEDRVQQVNALEQMAEEIFESIPVEVTEDQINQSTVLMMLGVPDMPAWFDGHDLDYLTQLIRRHFRYEKGGEDA